MRIDSIKLKNFRGISDLKLEFHKRTTVIYGINGMGKSAVLEACNILFSKILSETAMDMGIGKCLITERDVKVGETDTEIRGEFSDGGETYSYYRKRREGKNTHNSGLLQELAQHLRERYVGEIISEEEDEEHSAGIEKRKLLWENDSSMPIYVFYGVNRYIEGRRYLRKKYAGNSGKLDAWRDDIFDGVIDFSVFFEWFRSRQEYENSIKIEENTFVDPQLEAARAAILKALGGQFSSVRIRILEDEAELVLVKNGTELSVRQLSEGEKSVIALAGDIARRLSIANPDNEDILSAEGIVLIDEIDLHLHPLWQAVILTTLMETFVNLQFIVTTHSSKVLSEAGKEIGILKLEMREGAVEACAIPPLKGWDVNTILEEYMETASMNQETKEKISRMFALIEENKLAEAEQIADELERMTDSENLSVVRARVLIARGR